MKILSKLLTRNFQSNLSVNRLSHLNAYVSDLEQRTLLSKSYPNNLLTTCDANLKNLPKCLYAGFDPTADSLHIGNLLILLNLIRGSQYGCQPIALVGGFTALVGDPSGRTTEREIIPGDVVTQYSECIAKQIRQIGENSLKNSLDIIIVNNMDWYKNITLEKYFAICKKFRISEINQLGPIKKRLAHNATISYTEFSYPNLQAYDWAQLANKYQCFFQIGGSDQLGHLDFGAHYINRTMNNAFAAGVCLPLLTDSDGNKLGKSVGGGVWLAAEKTSPYHFYQFFRQLPDKTAIELILKFSLKPYEEVHEIIQSHNNNLGKWIAQDALAAELTEIVHGFDGLKTARRCSQVVFNGSMDDIKSLSSNDLRDLFGKALTVEKSKINTMGDFADITRQDKQKGRILMTKGALKINGERIVDPEQKFDSSKIVLSPAEDLVLICWGKRNFQLVQLV